MGETKGFLFFIGNFFGKKKFVTSLLIERQEKSQNLGSIPIALQKLCKKNQAPGTKPPTGVNRVKRNNSIYIQYIVKLTYLQKSFSSAVS